MSATRILPPPLGYLFLEGRALPELSLMFASLPLLRLAPRGDGHPVLVLPGFTAAHTSTLVLRRYLRTRGYHAHGWRLGRNMGPSEHVVTNLPQRLQEVRKKHGRKVSLIGWSLGGIYARELAREYPEDVRQVITLASPFRDPYASNVISGSGRSVRADSLGDEDEGLARMRQPLSVPTTAIYSKSDGIVPWQNCLEEEGPQRQNIEVWSSHCGMGHYPRVLQIIADRLAQREGRWAKYSIW